MRAARGGSSPLTRIFSRSNFLADVFIPSRLNATGLRLTSWTAYKMNCIVLAAGYATRLYPLTLNFPKPLLSVGGKTIVDWLLDDVGALGKIERCVVVSNSRYYDSFVSWRDAKRNSAAPFPTEIEIVDDGSETNDARVGAVKDVLFAMEALDLSGDTLIMAGDNVLDFSLRAFIEYFETKRSTVVMRAYEESLDDLRKRGVIELGEDDRVVAMEEKPAEPKTHWRCPPFYLYKDLTPAKIRAALDEGCGFDAPGSLVGNFCQKEPVFAMEASGKFYDIGNLESYERVKAEYSGVVK